MKKKKKKKGKYTNLWSLSNKNKQKKKTEQKNRMPQNSDGVITKKYNHNFIILVLTYKLLHEL
jgi:hypothetical protein